MGIRNATLLFYKVTQGINPAYALVFLLLLAGEWSYGQCVSLTTLGSGSHQSFNTLSNTAGSTTNNLTITGWFLTETGGGARDNEQYAVDNGGSNTGDTYSYGTAAASDRALGGLRSGTLIPVFGSCFTNNTGSTISSLAIAYTGEEWRLGTAARTDQLDFQYSLNATSLTTGTWTDVNTLDFITPNTAAPTGEKDGNAAAFRTALSSTISGLSIPNGATFWIRWNDSDATGADDGLAVDDFSLTPNAAIPPDYTISTTGNAIVITDISGNSDQLDISQNAGNIRFDVMPSTRTYSINNGPTTQFSTSAEVAIVANNPIMVNAAAGNDVIIVAAFAPALPSLTINGGTGDDFVTFNGDITFETDANLNVDLQNDDAMTPGTDAVTVAANANLLLSGTGSATVKVSRYVDINTGGSIETATGNLTVETNQQNTPTIGSFYGILINGGALKTSGSGTLTVKGKGGTDAVGGQKGIYVVNSGQISGGSTGAVIVEGTGGPSAGNFNDGLFVDANGIITSLGGNVSVTGIGNGTGSSETHFGVFLRSGGMITAGGTGSVTVHGTGGATAGSNNRGVVVFTSNTRITSSGGNVSVTGQGGGTGSSGANWGVYLLSAGEITAGGSGTVTVNGTGGAFSGNFNYGVFIEGANARITSFDGAVSVTGQGGGSGASTDNVGVYISTNAGIIAGGSGTVTIQGNGGATTGSNNHGIVVSSTFTFIGSSGGNVSVTGQGGGTGSSGSNWGVYLLSGGQITAGGSGTVTVNGTGGGSGGDSNYGVFIQVANASISSSGGAVNVTGQGGGSGTSNSNYGVFIQNGGFITTGGSGTVTVQGTGGASTGSGNYGVLVNGAFAQIASSGGNVSVTGQGTGSAADIITQSGGAITSTSTSAGITLHSTNNGTWPNTSGTDVSTTATQKTTFGAGSKLNIDIDGLTVNTQYQQLGVVGMIDLNGAGLTFAGSTYTPVSGNTFIIVNNDGTDLVIGTFNGLPQGATIPNFLGSGLPASITYTGGTGNDVVLTVINNVVCYADTDGDGFGDPNTSMTFSGSCGVGFVADNTDCNDTDEEINPTANEICDGIDNDCDTQIDEGLTFTTYYTDADGDGYGTGVGQSLCADPGPGFATLDGDCDDTDEEINPAANEICDGIDNDCDTQIDEGLTFTTYYTDADGDGYGTGVGQSLCADPGPGFATLDGDCDDTDEEINPAANEICDGIDNDCDTQIDEGLTFTTYYTDADGDGYGTGVGQSLCADPGAGFATLDGDCDDTDEEINPAANEICDGIDNDCDTQIDEGLTFTTYYTDADGDGYGTGVGQSLCADPGAGFATLDGDCDDTDEEINPAANEICDGIDNDCDTQIDEGITFTTYYTDADGDGYGTGVGQSLCADPGAGFATLDGDCDDTDEEINPAANEICDGIDNDCDTQIDEGITFTTYYTDADGDGYGTGVGQSLCADPGAGFATLDGDCDDTDEEINPAANEICDGIDNDCDTQIDEGITFTTYYTDADGDGYGTGVGQSLCADPGPGFATLDGDCDDTDEEINPAANEICDYVKLTRVTFTTYYTDADGDMAQA